MFKFLYCLLFVTIQYGDISGQPEDAQQINQHFYNNIHKLIGSKYDNKVDSEVSCLFRHYSDSIRGRVCDENVSFQAFSAGSDE